VERSRSSTGGRLDVRELGAVFAGGSLGALARAALTEALPVRAASFPWTTFAVNVAGALVIGYAGTRLQADSPSGRRRRSFIASGVCGAFTTFSTLMLELERLLARGDGALAGGYLAASVLAGLLAVMLGRALALGAGAPAPAEE
jgi:CrcB protein